MFLQFLLFLSIFTPVVCMENYEMAEQSTQKAIIGGCKFCDNCCKEETLERFNKCSKCHNVSYCCVDCQKNDWRVRHKQECGKEFDRATRNDEIKKLRETLVEVIEMRLAYIIPANSSSVSEKLEEHGNLYRKYLAEILKSALIKKDDAEFNVHAALFAATITEPLLETFPTDDNDPILDMINGFIVYFDVFLSRKAKGIPATHIKIITSFFKVFETTRAQSKNLTTLGYPEEAVNALQNLRRKAIQTIVEAYFETKQTLSLEEMLSIWAYKLFVSLPCLYVDKVDQLVTSLNKEVMNEQCIIELFDCIKHDVVLKNSIETDTGWAKFHQNGLAALRNQLDKNFKQKKLAVPTLRSLGKFLSTESAFRKISLIATDECRFLSNLLCSLYYK